MEKTISVAFYNRQRNAILLRDGELPSLYIPSESDKDVEDAVDNLLREMSIITESIGTRFYCKHRENGLVAIRYRIQLPDQLSHDRWITIEDLPDLRSEFVEKEQCWEIIRNALVSIDYPSPGMIPECCHLTARNSAGSWAGVRQCASFHLVEFRENGAYCSYDILRNMKRTSA